MLLSGLRGDFAASRDKKRRRKKVKRARIKRRKWRKEGRGILFIVRDGSFEIAFFILEEKILILHVEPDIIIGFYGEQPNADYDTPYDTEYMFLTFIQ